MDPLDKMCHTCMFNEVKSLKTLLEDIKLKQNKKKNNISKHEHKALKLLPKNNIIIKPTEKGSPVFILDKRDYIEEVHLQLTSTGHYEKSNATFHSKVREKYNAVLE